MNLISMVRGILSRLSIYPRLGLQAKMAGIVIVGVFSLIALFAYIGTTALDQETQRSLQERVVLAQTTARHIDYTLASIEQSLKLAAQQEGINDPSRCMDALRLIYPRLEFFGSQLFIADRSSLVIAAYPPLASDLVLNSRAIQNVFLGQSFAVSRASNEMTIAIVPLHDAAANVSSVLVLSIDLTSPNLHAFTDAVNLGSTGYMDLVDSDGLILASTQPQRVGQLGDHNAVLAKMIQNGQPTVSRCHVCHTTSDMAETSPQMLAFAPLRQVPWGVTVRQDEEEILMPARDLQGRITAAGTLALMGALFLVYLTTRSVIVPVQALTAATQRVAAGDLETPIADYGKDEIGMLARSFETMRARLKSSIDEIQLWNRTLDTRVQERTAELVLAQQDAQRSRDDLVRRNRELVAINTVAGIVGRSLVLNECLQSALIEVRSLTQMDVGAIYLLQGEERELKLRLAYGMSDENAEAIGRMALTDTACGGVLQIGEPVIARNISAGSRPTPNLLEREKLDVLVHVPLIAKGTAVGTLCLGVHEPREFAESDIAFLSAIGSQIAIAVENARLYEELGRKEQLRGELLHRIIQVQEDERKRIARELHDELSQTLTAMLFALDGIPAKSQTPQHHQMRQMAVSAIDNVHKVIFDLRPTMLDQLGLVAALRWYTETRLGSNGTQIHMTESGEVRRLPPTLETALFRTVQEAINNVARHAGARHLKIDFDFQPKRIEIRVEDDGIGFDLRHIQVLPNSSSGLGLLSMQERMSAVDGEFFINTALHQGTEIILRAPISGGKNGTH